MIGGVWETLVDLVPGATLNLTIGGEDPVVAQAVWRVGDEDVAWLGMHFWPTWVWYKNLQLADDHQRQGVFTEIARRHTALFTLLGLKAMVCRPLDEPSEAVMLAGGFAWSDWQGTRCLVKAL
jgi:hypothetical protein